LQAKHFKLGLSKKDYTVLEVLKESLLCVVPS